MLFPWLLRVARQGRRRSYGCQLCSRSFWSMGVVAEYTLFLWDLVWPSFFGCSTNIPSVSWMFYLDPYPS